MCDPVTLTALAVASTVTQGIGAMKQGRYQNNIAQYNARNQENQAIQLKNQANEAENKQREQTQQLIGKQRAAAAANGVNVDSGSALQLQKDSALFGEVDALKIRSNYQNEVNALNTQSELTSLEGEASLASGKNAFGTSLLSAAPDGASTYVSQKWYKQNSAANTTANTVPVIAGKV